MVSTKIGFPSLSAKARGLSGLSPSGLGRAGLAKNGFGRAGFWARPEARASLTCIVEQLRHFSKIFTPGYILTLTATFFATIRTMYLSDEW